METRIFCEEHGEELEVENVTSRGGDVYVFVAPCKKCAAQQGAQLTAAGVESDGENLDSGGQLTPVR